MSVASGELVLYIDNTFALYKQKQQIQKRLAMRKRKGEYERQLGQKAFMHLANAGAKSYVREMKLDEPWSRAFTPADREQAAKEFEAEFRQEYQLGALEYLLPAKLQRNKNPSPRKKTAKKKAAKKKTTRRKKKTSSKRCPVGTEVQTLIFRKDIFARVDEAKVWLRRNGFKVPKVDETEDSWRFRQRLTKYFRPGSFRTIQLGSVAAVIGCPR